MKVYTKTGDKGETSLVGGTRISKADAKIEAYGTVDELNSCIGVFVNAHEGIFATFLKRIQHRLFNIGSILASEPNLDFELPSVSSDDIEALEKEMDRLNTHLPKLKNFVLPSGSVLNAQAHIARCVCRRAERRVVVLQDNDYVVIVQYLNRLSDYLFVLSREFLHLEGKEEVLWQKDMP